MADVHFTNTTLQSRNSSIFEFNHKNEEEIMEFLSTALQT